MKSKNTIEIEVPKFVLYKSGSLEGFAFSVKQLREITSERPEKIKSYIENGALTTHGLKIIPMPDDAKEVCKKFKAKVESEGLRMNDLYIEQVQKSKTADSIGCDKEIAMLFLTNIRKQINNLKLNNFPKHLK